MPGIYLDAFATTPLDPRVGEQLRPWLEGHAVGNAGSAHLFGERAAEELAVARRRIAALVGAVPRSVILTSGATESNNLALNVAGRAFDRHVIAGATEHPSVREPLRALEASGVIEVTWLGVDRRGRIDLAELRESLRSDTALVSLMAANNELGTLHPVGEIGALLADTETLFHCDGAQAAGKIPLDVASDGIDLLSLSAHKMYGPMGAGTLVVSERARAKLRPLLRGGRQEQGLRSGTVNVPGAVGFGAACAIAAEELETEGARLAALRDRLEAALVGLGGVAVNGDRDRRLPGSLSVTIEDVPADALLAGCPKLAFSRGSACSTGSPEPSHVLLATGLSDEEAEHTVRFGLTRQSTDADIARAGELISACVERVRGFVHA